MARWARCRHLETLGQRGDPVAVAHPDLVALEPSVQTPSKSGLSFSISTSAAEFAVMAALDLAAELGAHGLFAVADAENRHAGIETMCGARGLPISMVDAGPPDRITAFGFRR
jgi:hypothetical protein